MPKKIIVVDDETHLLELTKNVLEKRGFTVFTFQDGEKVLTEIKRISPDLIILDDLMPGKNGSDICHEIKTNPITQNIPVLIATGLSLEENNPTLLKPNGYLKKPFEIEELVKKVILLIDKN